MNKLLSFEKDVYIIFLIGIAYINYFIIIKEKCQWLYVQNVILICKAALFLFSPLFNSREKIRRCFPPKNGLQKGICVVCK